MADLKIAFHREILTDFACGSGLVILGEGLGIWELTKAFAELYASEKLLVFFLGLGPEEEALLMARFIAGEHQLVGHVPFSVVNNETSGQDRVKIYAAGGVISITSRIMVTDLLTGRLPTFLATGICLWRAEQVTENGLEAFALHLFRQSNRQGFIKAFSEAPEPFTAGFNQAEKMMKWLGVQELLLFPRFHQLVKDELDPVDVGVEELVVRPTGRAKIVQVALIDLVSACLRELTRLNPYLDADCLSLDALLGRQFDVLVRQQLEPVWHQIGFRTRQLVNELSSLRSLLHALFSYDAVIFLKYLETALEAERDSNWIVLDSANTLIQMARERVAQKEMPPKWRVLHDLLSGELKDAECVLVMTDTEASKSQLQVLIKDGPERLLEKHLMSYEAWKRTLRSQPESRWPSRKRTKLVPKPAQSTPSAETNDGNEPADATVDVSQLLVDFAQSQQDDLLESRAHVHCYSDINGLELLRSLCPTAVVLYSQRLGFVRSLELFAREKQSSHVKVYSLYHQESTEEQAALLEIRREKNAFEALIKAKAEMAPIIQHDNVEDNDDGPLMEQSSREPAIVSGKRLIVDMRELRSALPFVLHRTGMFRLQPETIAIGDYLLTPDCAVERKAIPDLIQSLASGRLYTQAEALCRTYKQPMLLIEFDETRRAFSLLGLGDLKADISGTDLLSRLILLLIHFPRLRIIWSSSLQATTDIFSDLQRDQPDPSYNQAAIEEAAYNATPRAILEALPGVNQQNLYKLMNACENLRDLTEQSVEELKYIIGPLNGQMLFNFLHKP